MEKKDNIFISELKHHISSNASTPPRPKHFKRTKLMGKLSPTGLILFVVAIAGAMLIGSLFSVFTVQISNTATLEGQQRPLFEINGIELDTPWLNLTDSFTLSAGDSKTCSFYILNKDAGAWGTNVDLGDLSFYTETTHMFYGLNVTIEDLKLNGIETTSWIFCPNDNLSFNVTYSLHNEFVTAAEPYVSNITISWERTNAPPIAVNDVTSHATQTAFDFDVLANDYDPDNSPDPLIITNAVLTSGNHITVSIVANQLHIVPDGAWTGTAIFTYTISDGLETDTATLTVNYG